MRQTITGAVKIYEIGQTYHVTDRQAIRWKKAGVCEWIEVTPKPEPPKPAPPKPEPPKPAPKAEPPKPEPPKATDTAAIDPKAETADVKPKKAKATEGK